MRSRTLRGLGLALLCGGALPASQRRHDHAEHAADGFENGGTCTLREAVTTANDESHRHRPGCNGDTAGLDTIVLQAGQTYDADHAAPWTNNNVSGTWTSPVAAARPSAARGPGWRRSTPTATSSAGPRRRPTGPRDRGATVGRRRENARGHPTFRAGASSSAEAAASSAVAPLTLTDSEVTSNILGAAHRQRRSSGGAGIQSVTPGSLTLTRSTVANNLAKASPSVPATRPAEAGSCSAPARGSECHQQHDLRQRRRLVGVTGGWHHDLGRASTGSATSGSRRT